MTTQKLYELHSQRPFRAFRIFLADGTSVAVQHPENLAYKEKSRVAYVFTGPGDQGEFIDLLLVTKLVTGNGHASRRR